MVMYNVKNIYELYFEQEFKNSKKKLLTLLA
jgi:hypothetical protein